MNIGTIEGTNEGVRIIIRRKQKKVVGTNGFEPILAFIISPIPKACET